MYFFLTPQRGRATLLFNRRPKFHLVFSLVQPPSDRQRDSLLVLGGKISALRWYTGQSSQTRRSSRVPLEKELHVTWRHKATQNACHPGLPLNWKQLAMSTKLMANIWQSRTLKIMKKQFLDHGLGIKPHWDGRTQKTAKRPQLKLVKLTTVNN